MTAASATRARYAKVGLVATVAIVAIVAGACTGATASPSPSPSVPPVASPSPDPSAAPSPQPSLDPSESPSAGLDPVDLVTLPGHDISVEIDDQVGTVVGASSGRPGDGMSVRWFDDMVERIDDRTIEVTWVGLPVDEEVSLIVSEYEGGYRLHFGQSNPPLNSDAIGFDRILVLEFDQPVDPAKVVVTFEGGPENEG